MLLAKIFQSEYVTKQHLPAGSLNLFQPSLFEDCSETRKVSRCEAHKVQLTSHSYKITATFEFRLQQEHIDCSRDKKYEDCGLHSSRPTGKVKTTLFNFTYSQSSDESAIPSEIVLSRKHDGQAPKTQPSLIAGISRCHPGNVTKK